jgi:NADH:ubiquinone oxidoreductase subunit 5 (subunit L)/multisubunit Na+/H+ antiporter MnhA subunit
MMSLALLLVPGSALLAAAAIATVRPSPAASARLAVRASAASTLLAGFVLVSVLAGDPVSALLLGSDGRAVVGLHADAVGAFLAALTAAVGLVVQSFAARALVGDQRARRWFALSSLLAGSTSLVAVSATGSGLAVGWVLTGLALVALVGHRSGWAPAADAVRRTRRTFAVGDLALLAAGVVAATAVGDLDLRRLPDDVAALGNGRTTAIALLLVVAGLCRSALVPAHRWLPSTVAAPTPVSALLHAGVVNGAGVLIIRVAPVVTPSATAMALLFAVGVATAVLATAVMIVRADVKGGLAWSTAGQMGFMAVQLGVGAFAAALFHVVGHAMYKAALFLGAGGTVQRAARHRHLPTARTIVSRRVRLGLSIGVPALATATALALLDPHLGAAGTILVATFGWLTTFRLVDGWLASAPGSPSGVAIGVAVGLAAPTVYVAGVRTFEHSVASALPASAPGAVGPVWLLVTIVAIAAAALAVRSNRRVYAALVGFGAPPVSRRSSAEDLAAPAAVPVPAHRSAHISHHTELGYLT